MIFGGISETLEASELELYFKRFLDVYGDKPKNITALKDLYELAYRQWDTFEPVSDEIYKKLTEYLMSALKLNSYEIMDVIVSIIENLSLKEVFQYIINEKGNIRNIAVKELVEEAENDYADIISDPFSVL